jgi:DNA adenine methylase
VTEKTLIRWAGSKRRLVPALVERAPASFESYFEPFAGSACLYFSLAPARAILGDRNKALIGMYRTLRSRASYIAGLLDDMPRTKRFYYRLRRQPPDIMSACERAARFIYLNRYCFNGVYRENKKGEFNVPRGTKTSGLPSLEELQAAARRLRNVDLRACDFSECISDAKKNDFIYMDPPYAIHRRRHRGEYGYGAFDSYDLDRLVSVARDADRAGAFVLISYADTRKLRQTFKDWHVESIMVGRSVSGFHSERKPVRELLIRNY